MAAVLTVPLAAALTAGPVVGPALVWVALLGPGLCALAVLLLRRRAVVLVADVVASSVVLLCGVALLAGVADGGAAVVTAGGLLRVDPLAGYLLVVVGAVALTATWGGLSPGRARSRRGGRYTALVCLFLTAMVLAVVADDLGVTWVAVEGTTITTAFLVGFAGGRRAVEAAWKYVVLASVGVGIAFLGLVLLYAATRAAGDPTLSWVRLVTDRPAVDPTVARMGLLLAALGFATKAGLAPMHAWLPDAHSQAPAPVSGLMSGVLLAVAFGAVLRIQRLDAVLLDGAAVRTLLLVGGLLSLLVAAVLVVTQRDVKRMLAYSSIEHMGLVAVAAAVGNRLALAAMLVHLLVHGLAKASTFVMAGRVLAVEGTTAIADVQGLVRSAPRVGVPFLAGAVTLLGLPPSGLFLTEAALVVAGLRSGYGWAMAIVLVLLLVVFVGMGRAVMAMTLGAPPAPAGPPEPAAAEALSAPLAPVSLALAAACLLALATPLAGTLDSVVAVLGGAP
ncbi:MAG: hydrogenase [Actinobacteria bacterium]|nr:hydrogenase [Actinomycetota bacterium]